MSRKNQQSTKNNQFEIKLKCGTYNGQFEILHDNVTLIGEDAKTTRLFSATGAKEILPDGSKRGTFRTATLRLFGNNVRIKNLKIQNGAGAGNIAGQSVALYTDGDHIIIEDSCIISNQDTVFTAPLPPTNIDGSTTGMGPRGEFERTKGRHHFCRCYIEGDIDFIFGGAMALFEDCTIFSHTRQLEPDCEKSAAVHGYVTAASTPPDQEFGYLFYRCKIAGDCPAESVYLGRPWRDYAKTVFAECEIGRHIKRELFHDWDKPLAHTRAFYAVGNCNVEEDAPDWVKVLDTKAINEYKNSYWERFFSDNVL